jgi:4-hydroxy-3-methylbut-2-en-1-yl diphosphate synthase IspG/GcpE
VPYIREQLDKMGVHVPLDWRLPLQRASPADRIPGHAPQALSKYRINPGNVGKGDKHDRQFAHNDRGRHALRQAGAHWRELGQPGPGAAGAT